MDKIFALVENGSEEDRGVSVISGPVDSNLKKLHKEYRDLIDSDEKMIDRMFKAKESHAVETSETMGFASWLIKSKGFTRPKMGVFYVDDYKEEEFCKEYNGIRENPNTPRNLKEANEKIERIKKRMEKPIVQAADDPRLFCKGWSIYDDKNQDNCTMVYLPLEWARKK